MTNAIRGERAISPTPDFATIGEIVHEARRKLQPHVWDYLMGGAASEASLRRNALALERLALLPGMMTDVRTFDIGTNLFGMDLSMPVFPAPVGSLDLLDQDGVVASARAALEAGTTCCVGLLCRPDFVGVAKAAEGPLMLQLYIRGDDEWLLDIVRRAKASGYRALVLTVDSAVYARRDRDLANRFSTARAPDRVTGIGTQDAAMRRHQAGLTWEVFKRLRDATSLPIAIKGVMRPDDAERAVANGADAVYVSNHGGRQLDHAPAAIEQLPAIASAVGGRVPVLVDGGFMRGADIVKAIALGASAVGIGKLQGLALAAGGQAGVAQCLSILASEIRDTMLLLGCTGLDQLRPEHVTRSEPTRHQYDL